MGDLAQELMRPLILPSHYPPRRLPESGQTLQLYEQLAARGIEVGRKFKFRCHWNSICLTHETSASGKTLASSNIDELMYLRINWASTAHRSRHVSDVPFR